MGGILLEGAALFRVEQVRTGAGCMAHLKNRRASQEMESCAPGLQKEQSFCRVSSGNSHISWLRLLVVWMAGNAQSPGTFGAAVLACGLRLKE